jgi:hypothetical protein
LKAVQVEEEAHPPTNLLNFSIHLVVQFAKMFENQMNSERRKNDKRFSIYTAWVYHYFISVINNGGGMPAFVTVGYAGHLCISFAKCKHLSGGTAGIGKYNF